MSRRPKSGEFVIGPGRIYPTSSPEKIPVRTKLTLQGADKAKTNAHGFTVQEYNGGTVARVGDKGEAVEKPVKGRDGLKPGNLLIAPTLVGEVRAVVAKDSVGDLCWVSGGLVGDLEYDEERGYWITTLAIKKTLLT